jgi:hypothetical protein
MSILIQGTEIQNSQGQSTLIVKLYGVPFINALRARDTDCVIVLDGRRNNEERVVSETYSAISALASVGYIDFVLPVTVKAVSGVNRDSYPYSLSIKASQIVEIYANPQDSNDSIIRARDEDKIEDVFYTVDETLAAIVALIPSVAAAPTYKVYRALLTQTGTNAPVATVLENTLGGEIVWTRPGLAGSYSGKLTNMFPNENKVIIFTQQTYSTTYITTYAYYSDSNTILIETVDTSIDTALDGELYNTSIEIRVYD